MTTVSRKLEETFCSVLAAQMPDITVRAAHEDAVTTLPNVIISATSRGTIDSIKVNEDSAEECELQIECSVDAFATNAAQSLEHLAQHVRNAVETASPAGWLLLILDFESLTRNATDAIRSVTIVWRVFALTHYP